MSSVAPPPVAAQGPRSANLEIARPTIPFADGFTAARGVREAASGTEVDYPQGDVPPWPEYHGSVTHTSFDDWYYRIHVIPSSVALGILAGDTTRSVLVWNAFFRSVDLASVFLTNAEGITLDAPVSPPYTVGPLQALNYSLSVSTQGPPAIDASVTWVIDDVEYRVPITGRRSVLFPFKPNWRSEYMETYTWTTTVVAAWSGKEQRMKIAHSPRRSIEFSFQRAGDGSRLLDSMLFGWNGRFYSLPIWHEESRLATSLPPGSSVLVVDTTQMSLKVGSSIALIASETSYEVAEVLDYSDTSIEVKGLLANDWPAGTKVVPYVPALPQENVSVSHPVPHVSLATVRFLFDPQQVELLRLSAGEPALTYQGEELYLAETDWAKSLSTEYTANRRELDNDIGPIQVTRRGDYPVVSRSFRWVCRSKAAVDQLRSFFARREGRWRPVWMPSGTEDFVLAELVDPVTPAIVVRANDYGSMVWPQAIRRDIIIFLRDGTYFTRRIIEVTEAGNKTVLSLDAGFGEAIDPTQVKRVSYLGLFRLADDSVTFNWTTNHVATVETDFILTEPDL